MVCGGSGSSDNVKRLPKKYYKMYTHTQNKTLLDLPPSFSFPECYVFEVPPWDPGNMTAVSNQALFVPVSTLNGRWQSRAQILSSPVSQPVRLRSFLPSHQGIQREVQQSTVLFLWEIIFHLHNPVSFTTSPAVLDRTPTFEWLLPFKLIVRDSQPLWQQFLKVPSLSTDSPLTVFQEPQLLLFIIATVQAQAILSHLCIRSMNFLCNYI